MKSFFVCAVAISAAGCASTTSYMPPLIEPSMAVYSVTVPGSRDDVWAKAVPVLGKRFFIINNMDRSSGFMNVSYSGDPEQYVDCGTIRTGFQNLAGDRVFEFPASRQNQKFQLLHPTQGLFDVERSVSLDGRINLVFEDGLAGQTRVTATAKYVLTKTLRVPARNYSASDTISFNSGGAATFSSADDAPGTRCVATGVLEKEVLRAVQW